ncbi:NAD(P)-dependent dehydrogenase (short-subunit alcohol dehydrogenase family) [Kitasatospora gansuensis]|uniref:NAD(P)-dependent dehydrogenase (Short-subunit alcohol dehydrogenase family) n=1 Tax=Kitasatospora gansuensis TaxID=258050 RepID=A0A7W7WG84_9ACTN|nr:SDR family oxidoreductase [Kitasatospora gansuensis]MBB4945718.1 NAD(P)-dependent dehydrogenase (short-subunit alcohol dehydrogenase family) [Kitasatospora gansuensis]
MNRFEGRRVLITGAGSGIGQATVRRILAEGGLVVGADVAETGLAATRELAAADGTDGRLTTLTVDIGDEASVLAGVAQAVGTLGGLDALVNAAGILRSEHTDRTSLDLWNTILRVNLTGTFLMTREALPELLASGRGVVVNFSSTSASFAHPYMAAYAASKGGVQSFTHSLAVEYAQQGLRAVSVAPGSISSGMTDASGSSGQNRGPGIPADADMSLFAKLSPALRSGNGYGFAGPEAVAGVVAMLASDDGAFVTGTEIRIDGGTHA